MNDYLTIGEVAALLRVHPQTIYSAVRRGQLRATRIGSAIRVPVSSMNAYVAKRTKGAA